MAYQFTQTGQEIQYLLDEAMQLAEEYDSSVSYAVGDYCSHEGTLYRCTTATTGTWDASKWTDNVIVLNALRTLKGRMDTAEGEIDAAQEDISALNTSLILFKNVQRTVTQNNTIDVWYMNTAFPPKSGYSRIIVGLRSNNQECVVTGWKYNENGEPQWMVRKFASGSVADVTYYATLLYLPDSNVWG